MMSCHEVKTYLTQLQDDDYEVGEKDRIRVNEHLARCPACANDARQLALVWDWLDEYPIVEPSPTFKEKFWAKAAQLEKTPPRPFFTRWATLLSDRNWKVMAVAASMMLLLVVGYGIFPPSLQNRDKFDEQLLREVNRLVNTDVDEPLSSLEERSNSKSEKQELSTPERTVKQGKVR